MYHGVQHLNLSNLSDPDQDPAQAKWLVYSVPQHFPGCTSPQLCVNSKKACGIAGSVMPALKMLPSLKDIQVTVPSPVPLSSLGTLLHSMQKQLSGLNSLSFDVKQQGWAGAERVWQALGRFSQLTELVINFDLEVTDGLTGDDLEQLRALTQLQSLDLGGWYMMEACKSPMLSVHLLQSLTALTNLDVDSCPLNEMACVSVCTALQRFAVWCDDGDEMEMTDVHWHVLAGLTNLTFLCVWNALVVSAPPACFDALQRLTKLQDFGAFAVGQPLLPALAACTQLTWLSGNWLQPAPSSESVHARNDMGGECVVLPTVVELDFATGAIPCAAFPNLQYIRNAGTMELTSLHAVTSCCTGLCVLESCKDAYDMYCSLPPHEPIAARVACLQALTRLHHLQEVCLSLTDNAELVAVATAACTLVAFQLKELNIVLPAVSSVSVSGLSQLARVRGIRKLALRVMSDALVSTDSDAFMVLCALWGAESVHIELATAQKKQLMDAAWAQLTQSGLPRPRDVVVKLSDA